MSYTLSEYAEMHYFYGVAQGNDREAARLYREQLQRRGGPQPAHYPDHRVFIDTHNTLMAGHIPGQRGGREGIPRFDPDRRERVLEEVQRNGRRRNLLASRKMPRVTDEELREEIEKILKNADLSKTSTKKVIQKLEEVFDTELENRKAVIDKMVLDYVNSHDDDDDDEEEEEEAEAEEPKKLPKRTVAKATKTTRSKKARKASSDDEDDDDDSNDSEYEMVTTNAISPAKTSSIDVTGITDQTVTTNITVPEVAAESSSIDVTVVAGQQCDDASADDLEKLITAVDISETTTYALLQDLCNESLDSLAHMYQAATTPSGTAAPSSSTTTTMMTTTTMTTTVSEERLTESRVLSELAHRLYNTLDMSTARTELMGLVRANVALSDETRAILYSVMEHDLAHQSLETSRASNQPLPESEQQMNNVIHNAKMKILEQLTPWLWRNTEARESGGP